MKRTPNREQITDDGDEHRYYTGLPNLIDDFGLSVYARAVYSHMKRVTGATGRKPFDRTTRQIAKHLEISVGAAHNAKKELSDARLIVLEKIQTDTGDGDLSHLTDIWPE